MADAQKSHKDYFKNIWSQFLRAHFQNVQHVAVFFDVREQTAQYWWDAMHAPAGWVINRAWSEMPAAAAQHLRLVVDNGSTGERAGRSGPARENSRQVA